MSEPQREGAVVPSALVVVGPRREWSAVGGARVTGYAFRGDQLLRADQLAATVDATTPDALPALLDDLTGSFAAIKETPDAAYAIVDPIRGIPLFCVEEQNRRVVTDDPLAVAPATRAGGSDWKVRAEFLKCACVSAGDTLLDTVRQVEAGSLLRVPIDATQPVTNHQYYAFRSGLDPDTSANLVEAGYETHRAAVDRMIRFADDSLIVVPLSAGLDSGILAALLAASRVDRDQILTFTFGRPGNRESEVSRGVAESLGLRWEFVPYEESTWRELASQPSWPGYLAWASSLAGAPGFAEIPAVHALRDQGLVPDGSVVVPGHTLGFISGSFIPGSLLHRRRGSRATRHRCADAYLLQVPKQRCDRAAPRSFRHRGSRSRARACRSRRTRESVVDAARAARVAGGRVGMEGTAGQDHRQRRARLRGPGSPLGAAVVGSRRHGLLGEGPTAAARRATPPP